MLLDPYLHPPPFFVELICELEVGLVIMIFVGSLKRGLPTLFLQYSPGLCAAKSVHNVLPQPALCGLSSPEFQSLYHGTIIDSEDFRSPRWFQARVTPLYALFHASLSLHPLCAAITRCNHLLRN
jgi:hypothetical protein